MSMESATEGKDDEDEGVEARGEEEGLERDLSISWFLQRSQDREGGKEGGKIRKERAERKCI